MKGLVHKEKEVRLLFMNDFGKVLPSEFIPQLRETPPTLKLEGGVKDYELPEIEEGDIEDFEDYKKENLIQQSSESTDTELKA
jgi:hypothetical protein